jgi:hypothetical protein
MGLFGKSRKTARHTDAGGDDPPDLEGSRGATRRIASLPGGRRTKWLVLVFWVAVVAVAGPLSAKLNSAQQNDASEWLPNNAESTQVVELAKRLCPVTCSLPWWSTNAPTVR